MKKILTTIAAAALIMGGFNAEAGNPKRSGQAGATQLLINPWAKSAGWYGADMAGISGVEAMNFNPAGMMGVPNTEFIFSRSSWLVGTGIGINAFGFTQRLGGDGGINTLGFSITSFDIGDIIITTEQQPDGGLGTFSPQLMNIGIAYGHTF
ncbi:MAG: DUF3308 domain-containing protein, partial [Bacteroidota bacterium]|nr:DUF3308 domain-containing protein [Bacteroidota bacterium]